VRQIAFAGYSWPLYLIERCRLQPTDQPQSAQSPEPFSDCEYTNCNVFRSAFREGADPHYFVVETGTAILCAPRSCPIRCKISTSVTHPRRLPSSDASCVEVVAVTFAGPGRRRSGAIPGGWYGKDCDYRTDSSACHRTNAKLKTINTTLPISSISATSPSPRMRCSCRISLYLN